MTTIINLGTGGAVLNGQNGSTAGADSNDALFLEWDGLNYVYLPGVSGNRLTVPDEAALDITGDIDVRVQIAHTSWIAANGLAAKINTDNAWRFYINATGNLNFDTYESDNTVRTHVSTTTLASLNNNQSYWLRATVDVDNGSGGHTTRFFTSLNGVEWLQLGADVVTAVVTNIKSTSDPVFVGVSSGVLGVGNFYCAQIFDGIDGTLVLDVDTSVITSGAATSFTAITGQTVTINRSTAGRKSVAVVSPVWLFGTDDYMEVASNALLNFGASDSFTVVAIVRQWNTPAATERFVSKKSADTSVAGYALFSSTTNSVVFDTGDGVLRSFDSQANTWSGQLGIVSGVRVAGATLAAGFNGLVSGTTADGSVNSLSNSGVLRVGSLGGGASPGGYADMEFIATCVFRRALSAAEISAITSYYQARLS